MGVYGEHYKGVGSDVICGMSGERVTFPETSVTQPLKEKPLC